MAPPMTKRSQYERMAVLDQLLNNLDRPFFGWTNSGIQNGGATPDILVEGMKNAYDLEIPAIIKKATGKTPYKAYHDGEIPEPKQYWDREKADKLEYDETRPWYWRIDIDDELRNKLKDDKIHLYSQTGGVGLYAASQDEED